MNLASIFLPSFFFIYLDIHLDIYLDFIYLVFQLYIIHCFSIVLMYYNYHITYSLIDNVKVIVTLLLFVALSIFYIRIVFEISRNFWRGLASGGQTVPGKRQVRDADGTVATPSEVCMLYIQYWYLVRIIQRLENLVLVESNFLLNFFFDVCFHFFHSYVRILSLWIFGFGDISPLNFKFLSDILYSSYFSVE